MKNEYTIGYLMSDLKRVGPSNQTLNIIKYSFYKEKSIVITIFEESDDSMINEYRKENIEIVCLHLNKFNYINKGIKLLEKIIKDYGIKIIHSYGIRPDYISQIVTNKLNIEHIITLRNYPREDILTRMNFLQGHYALYKHLKVLKKAKYIVCCSKTIYDKMNLEYQFSNISYIRNGVDIDKFNVKNDPNMRKKLNLDDNTVVFISTGSFIKRKRIDETIEIFNNLKVNDSKLLLLGDGPLLKEIKCKNINENIIFLGKKNNVSDYLSISNYFISSSESEGLPNSVIEAIACGVPVILSDIPQHKEIFEILGNIGYSYKIGNVDDACEKYKLIDKKQYEIFKLNEQKIYNSELNMKNMSKKYSTLYNKILGEL